MPALRLGAVLLTGFLIGCVIYGCSPARSAKAASLKPDSERHAAPDFALKDADGKTVRLSDYKGKVVLLDFWATYCGPCKVEMPWFVELQKQYGPQGFQIVGVSMDDDSTSSKEIAKFADDLGVNYPILLGTESVGQSYGGVSVLPTTFFLDRDGKIIAREFGLQSRSVFVDHIKKALSQGQAVQAQK